MKTHIIGPNDAVFLPGTVFLILFSDERSDSGLYETLSLDQVNRIDQILDRWDKKY